MRVASLLVILAVIFGQTTDRPTVYTAEQADAGRMELRTNSFGACTDCHSATLGGRNGDAGELPPVSSLPEDYQTLIRGNRGKVPDLVGSAFRARWAGRTTKDLSTEFMERFGPPSGHLTEETRLNLIAYILQANGALPGAQPLTAATDVEIGSLIPGASR